MPARKAGARSWPALRAIACGDAISALSRSVNHRLSSGKPPACPGGIALPKSCQSRNISYEYIGDSKRIITRYGILRRFTSTYIDLHPAVARLVDFAA
jgi:hypothetical protein